MYVCNHCGELREELKTFKQNCGHTSLGQSIDETLVDDQCKCGGTFVEATQCEICGEWFDNDGLFGICESCLEAEETTDNALEMGKENKLSIDINGFVATVLTEEKINEILENWVQENIKDDNIDVMKYCEEDIPYFSDWVKYEHQKQKAMI